jgi:hypothetical protein
VRSAWTALRDLESLGQGNPRHRAPAAREERLGPDGDR